MSRKERRAKERREKIEKLHKPVKANPKVLWVIAIVTAIVVIASYSVRFVGE